MIGRRGFITGLGRLVLVIAMASPYVWIWHKVGVPAFFPVAIFFTASVAAVVMVLLSAALVTKWIVDGFRGVR